MFVYIETVTEDLLHVYFFFGSFVTERRQVTESMTDSNKAQKSSNSVGDIY